ncbi:MAG: hypothetical protein GC155_18315 [Alphaproteobacteria bacterium]|nr:hypothetical protein [Alphaproteobacteria bacterium]
MKGALSPSQRRAAVKVTVFHVPKGALATSRSPGKTRPTVAVWESPDSFRPENALGLPSPWVSLAIHLDSGVTERRFVEATEVRLIGKEANKLDDPTVGIDIARYGSTDAAASSSKKAEG